MTRTSKSPANRGLAFSSAIALALLAGCAGTGELAKAISFSAPAEARSGSKADKGIAKAEKLVVKQPRDVAARAALANLYLQAGRFDSAASTFSDAISLGDKTPRTALSLALAHIGGGRNRDAVALLDQWRDSIPAGDLGLALALAGETGRGVAILSDALRAGDNTAKLRQNLAYAYALDGRWNEARVMAAQDVPAGELDDRISNWAMLGKPEDYQRRIAGLLGAPVVTDSGQPAHLALGGAPTFGPASAEAAQVAAAPRGGELPALDGTPGYVDVPTQQVAAYAEPAAPEPLPAPSSSFDTAFTDAPAPASSTEFVSRPVVQEARARSESPNWRATQRPVPRAIAKLSLASAAKPSGKLAAADCTHLVQLGSFSSEANARRAWDIYRSRHPELREHELQITPAVVGGKKFWRVAAAGFDRRAATSMCSNVKGRGGACIAYAETRPMPGALPGSRGSGPMRARR